MPKAVRHSSKGFFIRDADRLLADQFVQSAPTPREMIEEGSGKTAAGRDAPPVDEEIYMEEEDGPWYPGRAKEEFNRRRRGQDAEAINQEDDPVQVGRRLATR